VGSNGRSSSLPRTADIVILGAGVGASIAFHLAERKTGNIVVPAVGLLMSDLVLDGKGQTADITAFRPNRFADNQTLIAEYEYVDD
jgi:glycine/D-amino acid oxidase-like deaminating enzyme